MTFQQKFNEFDGTTVHWHSPDATNIERLKRIQEELSVLIHEMEHCECDEGDTGAVNNRAYSCCESIRHKSRTSLLPNIGESNMTDEPRK